MSQRPNVLFILADQHNAKVLGHKGHGDVKTPTLDRLAAEGSRCDNAISQSPICTPSRVCWMSGQYCHNHGYYGLNGPRPRGLPTILGHFRRGGYRTAALGKIHCPEYWIEDDCDHFRETCGVSIGGRPEYLAYLKERGLEDVEDHGALHEFGRRGQQTCDARASKVSFEDSQEGWAAREAISFIEASHQAKTPFFCHLSLPKPHQCYAPSEPFWSMYDEQDLHLPPNADYDMTAARKAPHLIYAAQRWREGRWALLEPKTFEAARRRKLRGYLGCVSHVDHAVGLVLDCLDRFDLADDTIVVYSSDHGDYACEHGNMEKAPGICADAITRVPMLWRWPGHIAAGHVIEELVESVDFSATLPALAGLEALQSSDGRDISALLAGGSGAVHDVAVTEYAWSRSLRKGRYRLVHYPPEMFPDRPGFGELYDLEHDPWEMRNLFFDSNYQELVRELQTDLLNWLITHTRPATLLPFQVFDGPQAVTRYACSTNHDGKIHFDRIQTLAGGNYI